MTVVIVSRVTPALRGALTRWLLEIHPGVFVGTVSARVRARLWAMVQGRQRLGACTLIASAKNEQGFAIETNGDPRRALRDYDGLQLPAVATERAETTTEGG
jgi:CRISPR-associated endoribonuclease Cas2 subtype I-E